MTNTQGDGSRGSIKESREVEFSGYQGPPGIEEAEKIQKLILSKPSLSAPKSA